MDISQMLRDWQASQPSRKTNHHYDVAILRRDDQGQQLPALTCIMEQDEFWGLEEDWMKAIRVGGKIDAAGCYWITVDGKLARLGLLLNNIISLTGVSIEPQTEGEK
jgi:hypothetical protein